MSILDTCYVPSDDVVAREIQGHLVIVPITAGIGDLEDDLFTLNPTALDVWRACDGQTPVRTIVEQLSARYAAPRVLIERDVVNFVSTLCERRMLAAREG